MSACLITVSLQIIAVQDAIAKKKQILILANNYNLKVYRLYCRIGKFSSLLYIYLKLISPSKFQFLTVIKIINDKGTIIEHFNSKLNCRKCCTSWYWTVSLTHTHTHTTTVVRLCEGGLRCMVECYFPTV